MQRLFVQFLKLLILVSIISALSYNAKGHAQPTGLALKEGKFKINREISYNIKGWSAIIESVEVLNDKLMALHFFITNDTGKDQYTWLPKDYKSTVYITDNLGNKYPVLDFQGITKEPEKTRVPRGKTIRYCLVFPALREGIKPFSFTEGGYVFKNIQLSLGQETIAANPVVANGKIGMFQHGTLVTKTATGELMLASSPSEATHTHAGVDILANCGTPIYAFTDGQVKDLINNEQDNNFNALGYMLLIEHPTSIIGKIFYTFYLHMQNPPEVSNEEKVRAGQEIGKVGDTGAAHGCNTHFEIRYFPTRFLEDPNWNDPWNIYGKGDQRSAKQFRENWGDPVVFLSQVQPLEPQKVISSIEASQLDGVVFRMIGCLGEGSRAVRGDVPQDIDLSDDATTREVLEKAMQFAQEKCPQKVPYGDITVRLYQKDRMGLDIFVVNARNYDANQITWPEYTNRPKRERLQKEEAKRRAEEQRLAEERKKEKRKVEIVIESLPREVIFGIIRCDGSYRAVRGDIPDEIDLSNDTIARQTLEKAAYFAQEKCPNNKEPFGNINVFLCKSGEEISLAERLCSVVARNYDAHRLTWLEYDNRALEKILAEEKIKKRAEEAARKEVELRAQKEQDERSKAEFLKWLKDTGLKFAILTDEKAIEQFITGVRDRVFLKIYTSVNYYRDHVEDIKARNPQVLWDKMSTDFYLNHDRSFRKFMNSGKEGWEDWAAQSLTAHGMTGLFIIKSFRPFITAEMRWRILEKKNGILVFTHEPVKIVYVKINYPDPKYSPTIKNTVIKETLFKFDISKKSGLITSIKHLVQGDIAWPKTP